MGSTRGIMSWHPSGSGFARAWRLSRAFSLRSPVKRRYLVPLSPWSRRARSSHRGVHHAHSSVQATSHSSAAAAQATAHGGDSRSSGRARVAIGFLEWTVSEQCKASGSGNDGRLRATNYSRTITIYSLLPFLLKRMQNLLFDKSNNFKFNHIYIKNS